MIYKNNNALSIYPFKVLTDCPNFLIKDIKLNVPKKFNVIGVRKIDIRPDYLFLSLLGYSGVLHFTGYFLLLSSTVGNFISNNKDILGVIYLNLIPNLLVYRVYLLLILLLACCITYFESIAALSISYNFTGLLGVLRVALNSFKIYRNIDPGLLLNSVIKGPDGILILLLPLLSFNIIKQINLLPIKPTLVFLSKDKGITLVSDGIINQVLLTLDEAVADTITLSKDNNYMTIYITGSLAYSCAKLSDYTPGSGLLLLLLLLLLGGGSCPLYKIILGPFLFKISQTSAITSPGIPFPTAGYEYALLPGDSAFEGGVDADVSFISPGLGVTLPGYAQARANVGYFSTGVCANNIFDIQILNTTLTYTKGWVNLGAWDAWCSGGIMHHLHITIEKITIYKQCDLLEPEPKPDINIINSAFTLVIRTVALQAISEFDACYTSMQESIPCDTPNPENYPEN